MKTDQDSGRARRVLRMQAMTGFERLQRGLHLVAPQLGSVVDLRECEGDGQAGVRGESRHQLDFAHWRIEVFAYCAQGNELEDSCAGIAQRVTDTRSEERRV